MSGHLESFLIKTGDKLGNTDLSETLEMFNYKFSLKTPCLEVFSLKKFNFEKDTLYNCANKFQQAEQLFTETFRKLN